MFSRSVDDGTYAVIGPAVDGRIERAALKEGLLYFSFTVLGGEQAINHLRANRRLDVEVVILGERSQRIPDLGIDQRKWARHGAAWMSQYAEQGYFTFRTFMNTQRIEAGQIELQVRDGQRNVVRPVASGALSYRASVQIIP